MRKFILIYFILIVLPTKASNDLSIAIKVDSLLSKMTLEEKIGQMMQITVETILQKNDITLDPDKLKNALVNYKVGSILNVPGEVAQSPEFWGKFIAEIQEVAITETRLKIPIIYGLDQIHGGTYTAGATLFPQQITLAATWNPTHAHEMGEITAYETRASNVPWSFSPVLDLGSDPRFPRQYEGFGEDPYLISIFGRELIKGYEGEDNNLKDRFKVAACMKHFLGYSVPVSGKDRTPAYIPMNVLMEYHVPPFKAAIDAGAHTVMINSSIVNNMPVHANYDILTNLLRKELGFQGVIVTDWEDVDKLYSRDHLASSSVEAVKMAINAGIDMVMIPYKYEDFFHNIISLVKEGEIPLLRIDDAVRHILTLKMELNLFEVPNTNIEDYPKFASKKFEEASYDAAADAITLLKNTNGILPLKKAGRILVTGPNAVSRRSLNGGWTVSWQGEKIESYPERCPTIVEMMKQTFGDKNIVYIPGVSYQTNVRKYNTEFKDHFDEAVEAAKSVDYIVVCVGENSYAEKPGDLNDLYLNELQTELIKELLNTGKKIIVVLSEGRPRIISKFSSQVDAIVQSYLPGVNGAQAIVDVLSGKINPSGKLPYTYPAYPNSIVPYFHKYSEEQKESGGLYDYSGDYNPEYHFGFGLSYTTFEYSNPSINYTSLTIDSDENIVISIDVKNTGSREGKEVVQLYSSDLYASVIPDMKRLRRFMKVSLKPGETKKVTFKLNISDLAFYNFELRKIVEPGDFEWLIAASSDNIKAKLPFKVIK